jgi:hypothetical protein
MRTHPIVLLVLAFLIAACGDNNGPSTDGILLVSTSTAGSDPDPDGYVLAVDKADNASLKPTGTVAIGLPSGHHALRLLGVAPQCSVAADTVLEVDVPSRDTVAVGFDISCWASAARISVTTSGPDISGGYLVLVDGAQGPHLQPDDTVLTRVEPGSRTIALTNLASNCMTVGPASRTVTVEDPGVVPIEFAVACTAVTGVVGIRINASGAAVYEPHGVSLNGSPRFNGAPFSAPGVSYLDGVPPGHYLVSLADSPHCSVETGPQPATVTAGGPDRDTVDVDFSVTCSLPPDSSGTLRISTVTTGSVPPSTRYAVRYAAAGYWDYGFGDLAFLSSIEPNGTQSIEAAPSGFNGAGIYWYGFELDGVPSNCRVHSPSAPDPMGFTLATGGTLDLAFAVTCPP